MWNDVPDRLDYVDGVITDEQAEKINYLIINRRFRPWIEEEIAKYGLNCNFLINDVIFLQVLANSKNAQEACADYKQYYPQLAYKILTSNREYKREMLEFSKHIISEYLQVPELYGVITAKISYDAFEGGKIKLSYKSPNKVGLKLYLERCKEKHLGALEGIAHINHAAICLAILAICIFLPITICRFILLLYAIFEIVILSTSYERSLYSTRNFILRLANRLGARKTSLLAIGIGAFLVALVFMFN